MTQFIILSKEEVQDLNNDKPVSLFTVDGIKFVVCTKEYWLSGRDEEA